MARTLQGGKLSKGTMTAIPCLYMFYSLNMNRIVFPPLFMRLNMREVFMDEYRKFSRGCRERFRKVGLPSNFPNDKAEIDKTLQNLDAQDYHERLTAFMNDFISEWPQKWVGIIGLEDIRAMFIAGEVSAASVAELGQIVQKAVGTGIPQVLIDEDPSAVLVRGAQCVHTNSPWHLEMGGCLRDSLTDEQYGHLMKAAEKSVHAHLAAYLKGPEPESPEEWAKRKPKLITTAGEKGSTA
jgi:hypothetical protein